MMAFQFLGPIVASVLYVIVFQKAGFRGAILAVCAGPVVASLLAMLMIRMIIVGDGPGMMLVPLVALPLTLLPLLVLAFKSWPPVSTASTIRSE